MMYDFGEPKPGPKISRSGGQPNLCIRAGEMIANLLPCPKAVWTYPFRPLPDHGGPHILYPTEFYINAVEVRSQQVLPSLGDPSERDINLVLIPEEVEKPP